MFWFIKNYISKIVEDKGKDNFLLLLNGQVKHTESCAFEITTHHTSFGHIEREVRICHKETEEKSLLFPILSTLEEVGPLLNAKSIVQCPIREDACCPLILIQ